MPTRPATARILGLDLAADEKRAPALIREALATSGPLRIAAAYVTGDVLALLGLGRTRLKELVLVCDPFSGNCDPNVLNRLIDGRADVRCIPRMHAKVYISKRRAVIGSPNISGAALDGGPMGTVEAALAIEGRVLVAQATAWFDALTADARRWSDIRDDPAQLALITRAWEHKQGRGWPQGRRGRPLLDALKDPHFPWDGIVFTLVEQRDEAPGRQRVARIARSGGVALPRKWDFEWCEGASALAHTEAQVYAARPDGTDVLTLYVRLDPAGQIIAFTGAEADASRLVGAAMAEDGTLFSYYKPSTCRVSLTGPARKATIAELNSGLKRRPQMAKRIDVGRFVEPQLLAGLLK